MSMVDTVYVMSGGEFFQAACNGVATLIGTSTWDSLFRFCYLWDDVGIVPYIEIRTALFPSEHFLHRKMFVTPRRGGF